eukprot:m.84258 g.84258  ORF g.84258 m.84258 type:complete len:303 (-) comp14681_c0_seq3:121-1029(-)
MLSRVNKITMTLRTHRTTFETAVAIAIQLLNQPQGASVHQIHDFINDNDWLAVDSDIALKTVVQRVLAKNPAFDCNSSGILWTVNVDKLPASVRNTMSRLSVTKDAGLNTLAEVGSLALQALEPRTALPKENTGSPTPDQSASSSPCQSQEADSCASSVATSTQGNMSNSAEKQSPVHVPLMPHNVAQSQPPASIPQKLLSPQAQAELAAFSSMNTAMLHPMSQFQSQMQMMAMYQAQQAQQAQQALLYQQQVEAHMVECQRQMHARQAQATQVAHRRHLADAIDGLLSQLQHKAPQLFQVA